MNKKPWLSIVMFCLSVVLLAFGAASGAIGIFDTLYYKIKGIEPPKDSLYHLLGLCSIVVAWALYSKERLFRWRVEHPQILPAPNVQTVSATIIHAQLVNGRFDPYGNDFAAICNVYRLQGGPKLKNVHAGITVTRLKDVFAVVEASDACWMGETKPGIEFKPDTERGIVVFSWRLNGPVFVPHFVGRGIERIELKEHEILQVVVTLHDQDENVISRHYFNPVAVLSNDGFKRMGFQVQRDGQ